MKRSATLPLLVKQPKHLFLFEDQNGADGQSGCIAHAERLTSQRALAEKITGSEHGDDGFPSGPGSH